MDKDIIEKVFTEVLLSKNVFVEKCGRTTLTAEDKRIIEGFNRENFHDDLDNWKDDDFDGETHFEKHVKVQKDTKYNVSEESVVEKWSHGGFLIINGRIYNTETYKQKKKMGVVSDEVLDKEIASLQSAIDKSPRVPFDVVTHRVGHWEEGHKAGDVVVQKGFASTSYGEGIPVSTDIDEGFEITYYVPTGSKGMALSETQFNIYDGDERELLLGRYTRQYVLEQNDDLHTVEVLILPDR